MRAIMTYDVRWGCDVMRPVYDATDGKDGRVSIEVDPRLAHDCDATLAEARALWWLVDRPNVMIKIPATEEGLAAIASATAEGISVNVTLIFSLERYKKVMDSYLTGLERARDNGVDVSTIRSVASFFVSRIDTEVDKRLDEIGTDEAKTLRSKVAVANARLAYQAYEEVVGSDRWQSLEKAGAHRQRPLWASTSVKDPDLPDTMYVTELVAPDTVNTMPEATIEATADHAEITGDSITGNYDSAQEVLDRMERVGIAYDDVVKVVEDEGVDKFEKAGQEMVDTVSAALEKAKK
jgi:transaldolase